MSLFTPFAGWGIPTGDNKGLPKTRTTMEPADEELQQLTAPPARSSNNKARALIGCVALASTALLFAVTQQSKPKTSAAVLAAREMAWHRPYLQCSVMKGLPLSVVAVRPALSAAGSESKRCTRRSPSWRCLSQAGSAKTKLPGPQTGMRRKVSGEIEMLVPLQAASSAAPVAKRSS